MYRWNQLKQPACQSPSGESILSGNVLTRNELRIIYLQQAESVS
jgi:hypothetical protein